MKSATFQLVFLNVHIFVHVQFLFRNEQYTNFATELIWTFKSLPRVGDFDSIYSEGYNSKSYQGRVILYILSQLEPDSQFDVRIENTILRGGDRCTFRITRLPV